MFLFGCSADDTPVIKEEPTETLPLTQHVTMQMARERLCKILPQMALTTRAGKHFEIGAGIAYNKNHHPVTRAQEEALYYYFPIDNGRQYAIMSANAQLPQILALGDGTSGATNTESPIPESEKWNVNTVAYNTFATDSAYVDKDTTLYIVRGTPVFTPKTYEDPDYPVSLCPVQWDQNDFYRQFCPEIPGKPGEHANACCVATAVAQLFASLKHKTPGSSDFIIDWDLLLNCPNRASMDTNPDAQVHIAKLLYELGKKKNLDVTYHVNNTYLSTASPYSVKRTLENFGFQDGGKLVAYEDSLVINELRRKYPVLISGYPASGDTGHMWLLHGMIVGETPVYICRGAKIIYTSYEYNIYFQCNWGCSGGGDGYYLSTGFNPNIGPAYNPQNNPACQWDLGDLSYDKLIRVGVKYSADE